MYYKKYKRRIRYDTKEQTKKALKLGAPIVTFNSPFMVCYTLDNNNYAVIPTAEQMIGWLRSKGIKFHFDDDNNYWRISIDTEPISVGFEHNKELAAINKALDYLINKKEVI